MTCGGSLRCNGRAGIQTRCGPKASALRAGLCEKPLGFKERFALQFCRRVSDFCASGRQCSRRLSSFFLFCLLWNEGNYILVFIALVSTVRGVQPCLVRKRLVNHLSICGSRAPNPCEILIILEKILRGEAEIRDDSGLGVNVPREEAVLFAPIRACLGPQPWCCHGPLWLGLAVAVTQSKGMWGTGEAGEGMAAGGGVLLCLQRPHVGGSTLEKMRVFTLWRLADGISRGHPTPKLVGKHLATRRCMQILAPDRLPPIPTTWEMERGMADHRPIEEEEGPR